MNRQTDTWFRSGWSRGLVLAIAGIDLGAAIVALVGMPTPPEKVVAAATTLIPFPFILRFSRLGAHFLPGELKLIRTLRTVKIPWVRVKRFVIAPRGIQPLAVFVELTDGTRVWVEGVGPWGRFKRFSPELEAQVHEMNVRLHHVQSRRQFAE